jgi:DNA segregation ATPase FtsK/SpoIIIE, S-DNA-T family
MLKLYYLWDYYLGDVMSEKFNEKKYNHIQSNKRKREKFLQPLISEEDFKPTPDPFFSIVKNKKVTENRKPASETYYVSPMRGKIVNRATFPVTTSKGKIDKQYDFLRDNKKQSENLIKAKNGSEYYEFNLLNNRKPAQQPEVKPQSEYTEKPVEFKEEIHFESFEPTDSFTVSIDSPIKKTESRPHHVEAISILYEEEIELDDDRQIITSYDDSQNNFYFGDYEKKQLNQTNQNVRPQNNVSVHDYSNHEDRVRAEIKEIFAEFHDEPPKKKKNVFFEESFEFGPDTHEARQQVKQERSHYVEPEVTYDEEWEDEEPQRIEPNFKDLKREIDDVLRQDEKKEVVSKKPQRKPEREFKVEDDEQDFTEYLFPSLELLNQSTSFQTDQTDWINHQISVLDQTLESFGIGAKTVNYTIGPSVTRFEVEPDPGTKVSKITALQDDIKLRLAANDIFMEAPISGKSTVGIEVPNKESRMVYLKEILESNLYKQFKSPLKIALGLDITGQPIFSDISTMTHSLIAGSTGSGKSVCINTLIVSILYNALPNEVKLVLIDPKKVEFSLYRDIPHLLTPVINDAKGATATLKWLTEEMDRRYELIESVGARDIKSYNVKRNRSPEDLPKLPYIVVIIDELADLMMVAANEVEEYIQRISQLARAAGIHLIVATQRPSTNVITGTIKTNIPTRISFKVASAIDSRIILDDSGAEKLMGKGDMLFDENGKPHLKRLQGSFISDEEIERITAFCKEQASPNYVFTSEDLVKKETEFVMDYEDELFDDVVRFVIDLGEASASRIQRQFKVGYNRAARIIDMMEKFDIIGPHLGGSKPREVLMSIETYEDLMG